MPMRVAREEIKILVSRPDKKPYVKSVRKCMSSLYEIVYYPYREFEIEKDLFLISSKEAEQECFKFNRMVAGVKIYGSCVILTRQGSNLQSLSEQQIRNYMGKEF